MLSLDTEDDEEGEDDPQPVTDNTLTDPPALRTGLSSVESDRDGLLATIANIKVLSYLNEDALRECIEFAEYVSVGAGQSLFEQGGVVDGSLFAVINGCIRCRVNDSTFNTSAAAADDTTNGGDYDVDEDSNLTTTTFDFGSGEVITSLLTSFAALVESERSPEATYTNPGDHNFLLSTFSQGLSATALVDTRCIKIPVRCCRALLAKFPAEVHRMARIVLVRMQRVTVSTLVKFLDLSTEIVGIERENPEAVERLTESKGEFFLSLSLSLSLPRTHKTHSRTHAIAQNGSSLRTSSMPTTPTMLPPSIMTPSSASRAGLPRASLASAPREQRRSWPQAANLSP
jgi:CRP-like cAMP-binding protein